MSGSSKGRVKRQSEKSKEEEFAILFHSKEDCKGMYLSLGGSKLSSKAIPPLPPTASPRE
jgi:hypothetical protein